MLLPILEINPSLLAEVSIVIGYFQFGFQAYCTGKGEERNNMQKHMEKPNTYL